jgi:diadenosine tetraphosphate (Ap4A) HIT family hydrolase
VKEWPKDWDDQRRGKGCPMCAEGRPDDNGFGPRVFSGRYADAYLQRADLGQPGYTVIVWRGRHVADPTELSADEAAAYFAEVLKVARAIEAHYKPIKMNFEMLGNSLPHLHTHVVPRYLDDGSPGQPATFMRNVAAMPDVKIPEEVILRNAASLRVLLSAP